MHIENYPTCMLQLEETFAWIIMKLKQKKFDAFHNISYSIIQLFCPKIISPPFMLSLGRDRHIVG